MQKGSCAVTIEPRVEDLLASIRKAIDDDLGSEGNSTSGTSQGTLMRGALREMKVSYDGEGASREQADSEIAKLRDRIGRSRIESTLTAPKLSLKAKAEPQIASAQKGFSSILSGAQPLPPPVLRQTIDDADQYSDPQPEYHIPYQETGWEEPTPYNDPEPQAYIPADVYHQQQALISPQASYAAQASFQNLADTIMARAVGDRGLEDMTRDLLRNMLKNWLDDNLPDLVERLVREEIERVARPGR
jgi:uncharacterized protein